MSNGKVKESCCCNQPLSNLRMLFFPDGTKVGVRGLPEALAAAYAEGRQADADTAEKILNRLNENNFIPTSAYQEYRTALLEEYRKYKEKLSS